MNHVTFTIGQGLDASNAPITNLEVKRHIALEDIAKTFGGYTAIDANGGWLDPSGHLVTEPSLAVNVMTDADESTIQHEAEYLAEVFNQSAVMTSEDSAQVAFVPQVKQAA